LTRILVRQLLIEMSL
jgi:hypothetical protein